MPSITVWTLESDNDEKAAKCLAGKILHYYGKTDTFIRSIGNRRPKPLKNDDSPVNALIRQVELYLKEDNCLIFVIDTDGPMSSYQRKKEPNSFINQIHSVLSHEKFKGKVFLAEAKNELEAWLLIDCIGIFCYYASQRKQYKAKCREKVKKTDRFIKLVDKFQKGDTEKIVEPEMGGKGAKEYLIKYSKEILKMLNTNMPMKNVNENKYKEKMSPEIAEFIEINKTTIKRNQSFDYFSTLLLTCHVDSSQTNSDCTS